MFQSDGFLMLNAIVEPELSATQCGSESPGWPVTGLGTENVQRMIFRKHQFIFQKSRVRSDINAKISEDIRARN
jgi:hypothetical protein